MSRIKPVIVLTAITTIVAVLLILTYSFTYVDTSNMITDKLMNACTEAMGEGEFSIVSDWKAEGYAIDKPDNVEKMIKKSDGSIAFEIITNGYSKKGIDILVAKVQNKDFLEQFSGKKDSIELVKHSPASENEIQAVTGATYSSTGVTEAVNIALSVYPQLNVNG